MTNPKSFEAQQAYLDEKPFAGFKIDDNSILHELDGRHPCPSCGKSRKFFCYTCYVPIAELRGILPIVKLPIKIDIIKHKGEIDGKSTSAHAAILSPQDVNVYTYPDIPNYSQENVVLIYPSHNAITISQLVENSYESLTKNSRHPLEAHHPKGYPPGTLRKIAQNPLVALPNETTSKIPVTRAVFIDSTWNQSKGIFKDDRINRIPCVVIENRISQFWRHQKGSPRWYLATIEAIHQFLVELHLHRWGLHPNYKGIHNCFTENALSHFESLHRDNAEAYSGQYDNLLYFFQHMYDLIHSYYDHDNLHAYKRRLT